MVDDTPDDLVFELHNRALWGDHPYGYSILGTRETVSSLGVTELRELHARAYHPSQVVVAASGNVAHDALVETLSRTGWSDVPAGDARPLPVSVPMSAPPSRRHVQREGTQTHLVIGSRTVPYRDQRRYTVALVSMLLGGGMSSRLFQRVREELALAYAVFTYQSFHVDTGMHGVYLATTPEQLAQAYDAVCAEMKAVSEGGIPEAELAMGKSQLKGQLTLSLESVSSRMYRAAAVELYGEPFQPLDEVLAAIDRIDQVAVAAVCREFFSPDAQTVLSLGPGAAA